MKRWWAVLLVWLAFVPTAHGAAAEPLLARAEQLYRARDWSGAELAWRQALELELSSATRARVCRNLGNAAYRQDDLPRAVGWFEAARRLAPRDRDTWANLELARRKLQWAPADRGDLRAWFERLLRAWTAREAELLAWLGLLPLAACAGWEALRGGRAAKLALTIALLVACAAALPHFERSFAARAGECLVLARDGAALRAEPDPALPAVARLEAGARASRIDTWPGWVRVEAAGGVRGWIPDEQVFGLDR
jgi:hypothetical protein